MAKRQEFPPSVRRAALERAGGFCERRSSEGCTMKLIKRKYRFDHVLALGLTGKSTLDNCEVVCLACDAPKTYGQDIPMMAAARRWRAKHEGTWRASKRPVPGGRGSKWKRGFDGKVTER